MRSPIRLRQVEIALLGAFSVLIALGSSQVPQPALAIPAYQGDIDAVKIDADPDTADVQPCRSVGPNETFSIDFIVASIGASDSDNFASLGQVGFNFDTGDFSSPVIDFEPGALDDVSGFNLTAQGSITTKVPGKTHVAQAYFNFSGSDASALIGQVIAARATLMAGTGTGLKTISVTKTTPLDSNYDFFLGNDPNIVQPTSTQAATIAIGVACPADSQPTADPQEPTTAPATPMTITLTATNPGGTCPVTFIIVSEPANGDLGEITNVSCSEGTATATVLYTPRGESVGADTFTYKVSDGVNESEPVSVNISASGAEPPDVTSPGSSDTADMTGANGPDDTEPESPASDQGSDGGSNWTIIVVIIVVLVAVAALATGGVVWWRLRQPGSTGNG